MTCWGQFWQYLPIKCWDPSWWKWFSLNLTCVLVNGKYGFSAYLSCAYQYRQLGLATRAIYTSRNFCTEVRLKTGHCIYTWPSFGWIWAVHSCALEKGLAWLAVHCISFEIICKHRGIQMMHLEEWWHQTSDSSVVQTGSVIMAYRWCVCRNDEVRILTQAWSKPQV